MENGLNVWITKSINDLCEIGRGRVISQTEIAVNIGNYPVFSSQSQNNGEMGRINTYDFDGDFVTWTTDGAYAGTVFFRTGKFNCTNVCGTLSPKNNEDIDLKFLAYKLSTVAKNHVSYVGNPKLMNGVMGKISLQLPINKKEQSKIAEILSKVDKAISETEIIIAKHNRIKTGLMQDLLTKGIDENGNIRSEETHEFKDSPLGRIPKEWSIKKLGELIAAIDPQPDHRTPPAVLDGIPYLGISDFTSSGDIDIINCRKVGYNVLIKQSNLFNVDEGDIIFGKIGTIGKPKKLPNFQKSPFTLSANVILIKPIECPAFVYWTLISDYINDQVSLAIHSTSQPAFGMEKIRALNIVTPQPKEREVITEKLKAFENIFLEEEKKLSKLKSIKTGLMQDLLSGKKRVYI
jgi:type I restriction enzyme S subunit